MAVSTAVVVVGYNSKRWLGPCLAALNCVGSGLLIIYVDNASEDDSVSFVRQFVSVNIVQNESNLGFGVGCNLGAECARRLGAGVVIFLNPDVLADPTTLILLAEDVATDASLGAVGPLQLEYHDFNGRKCYNAWTRRAIVANHLMPIRHRTMDPLNEQEFSEWLDSDSNSHVEVKYVNGATFAIRLDLFEKIGGFDSAYFLFFEEVDLCRRLHWLGYRTLLRKDALVRHAWGGHQQEYRRAMWIRSKYVFIVTDAERPLLQAIWLLLVEAGLDLREFGVRAIPTIGRAITSLASDNRVIRASRRRNRGMVRLAAQRMTHPTVDARTSN